VIGQSKGILLVQWTTNLNQSHQFRSGNVTVTTGNSYLMPSPHISDATKRVALIPDIHVLLSAPNNSIQVNSSCSPSLKRTVRKNRLQKKSFGKRKRKRKGTLPCFYWLCVITQPVGQIKM
jgi:hypothetical protein